MRGHYTDRHLLSQPFASFFPCALRSGRLDGPWFSGGRERRGEVEMRGCAVEMTGCAVESLAQQHIRLVHSDTRGGMLEGHRAVTVPVASTWKERTPLALLLSPAPGTIRIVWLPLEPVTLTA